MQHAKTHVLHLVTNIQFFFANDPFRDEKFFYVFPNLKCADFIRSSDFNNEEAQEDNLNNSNALDTSPNVDTEYIVVKGNFNEIGSISS